MRELLAMGCLVLGILCFLYFITVVLYAGIFTSIVGIWFLAGLFFCGMCWALRSPCVREYPIANGIMKAIGVVIFVGILVFASITSKIMLGMKRVPVQKLEYVIILGAHVKGNVPSVALKRRLDCALDYQEAYPETLFVLSGGQGFGEDISEAQCMYEYLTTHGVPEEYLLLEDLSTSTKENLEFSDQLYHLKDKTVGVLSNDFHIFRALRMAEHEGYEKVQGIPASSDPIMQMHNVVREIFCTIYARIRGRI